MKPFDRLYNICKNPVFVIFFVGLMVVFYFFIDASLAEKFNANRLDVNYPLLVWITNLGLGAIYFGGLFLLALFYQYVKKNENIARNLWFLWLCEIATNSICLLLKIIIGRTRPDFLFEKGMYGFYPLKTNAHFWSLPSGHTTTIMTFVLGLSILLPRYGWLLIIGGFLVSLTRVLLTNHYLSDVFVAFYLAVIEIGLLRLWIDYYARKFTNIKLCRA